MSEEELRVLNRDSPDRTHDTQCSTPGTPSAKGLKVTETAAGARLKGRPAHWNGMVGSMLLKNSWRSAARPFWRLGGGGNWSG